MNVTTRRTRRKVKAVKYVEPEEEEEGDLFVKSDGQSDDEEDDEWKPAEVELDAEDTIEMGAAEGEGFEEDSARASLMVTDTDEATEGRVTEEIKGVSNVLQENMSKGNFEVLV